LPAMLVYAGISRLFPARGDCITVSLIYPGCGRPYEPGRRCGEIARLLAARVMQVQLSSKSAGALTFGRRINA
jgi:hypothetical protein